MNLHQPMPKPPREPLDLDALEDAARRMTTTGGGWRKTFDEPTILALIERVRRAEDRAAVYLAEAQLDEARAERAEPCLEPCGDEDCWRCFLVQSYAAVQDERDRAEARAERAEAALRALLVDWQGAWGHSIASDVQALQTWHLTLDEHRDAIRAALAPEQAP